MSKANKATGYQYLVKEIEDALLPPPDETLIIEDGHALFYCMKEVPGNFCQISNKVFDSMPKTSDVIFSTDMYKENSIKENECQRRECWEKLLIKGGHTKQPADWKLFLTNSDNKKPFIRVISNVWSSNSFAAKLKGREVIIVYEGIAHHRSF